MGQTCGLTSCRIPVVFVVTAFAVALSASCTNSTSVNDPRIVGAFFDLLPQLTDIDAQILRVFGVRRAPHRDENLLVRNDAAGVPGAGGSGGIGGNGTAAQYIQDGAGATGCLVTSGQVVPVGTVFGTGISCCVCTGADSYGCAVTPLPPTDAGVTFCQSRDDCAALRQADCIFDPGCSPPQGICTEYILSPVGLPGVNAVLDYCGCDGQTFHIDAYPDRPYSHLGSCQ